MDMGIIIKVTIATSTRGARSDMAEKSATRRFTARSAARVENLDTV